MERLVADGVIDGPGAIDAVGHRVVHGGPDFTDAALVDARVRNNRTARELAPLHWVNYVGIEACLKLMPGTPQVAVFDTAFHHSIPEYARTYALPAPLLKKYGIRRYGFHGTSHKYVARRAARLMGRRGGRAGLITLHLGNGSSLAAVRSGRCLDTSMGMTPLAGVVMGSRCGDIDPAVIPFLMEREGLTPPQMDRLLNKASGVLGLSGVSNDMREVIRRGGQGHAPSRLALDVFAYSIRKYIGAYHAILGGAQALVFTAGIGEKSAVIRAAVCKGLEGIGVRLDAGRNRRAVSREMAIHAPSSKIQVWVIPTREELMIAQETQRVVADAGAPRRRRTPR